MYQEDIFDMFSTFDNRKVNDIEIAECFMSSVSRKGDEEEAKLRCDENDNI